LVGFVGWHTGTSPYYLTQLPGWIAARSEWDADGDVVEFRFNV
jgi:hypothetical protein